jgi:hypothetical protein
MSNAALFFAIVLFTFSNHRDTVITQGYVLRRFINISISVKLNLVQESDS